MRVLTDHDGPYETTTTTATAVADPDLQIRVGGGGGGGGFHPDPEVMGGPVLKKGFFGPSGLSLV